MRRVKSVSPAIGRGFPAVARCIPTGSEQYDFIRYNSLMRTIVPLDKRSYSYAGTGYANPHAVSQIANGQSTTTYSYDQNGNLSQKTTDGVTTTYLWDYANRLIALGSGGATTTYGYDAFGSRVFQTTATSTTIYPFKWYSVASSTGSGATYATTTEYVFNGDTLLSTTDQQFVSGTATGTSQTSYIHPDHLGSTNVVTNASGTVVQTLDYFPFGAQRINSGSNATNRQFIGQFTDNSGLSYLNARYYEGSRGQFLSEDPSFLAVGDPSKLRQVTGLDQRTFLADPHLANSSSYGRDNPITNKDPSGNYLDISSSGTYMGWSGAVGFRFDGRGMGFYTEAGFGAGVAGWPVSIAYSPGEYARNADGQVTVGGSTMIYGPIGGGAAASGQYEPRSMSIKDPSYSGYGGLGIGWEAYARKQVGSIDYDWKAPPGLAWDKGSNFSTPNYKSPLIQNMIKPQPTISGRNTLIYNATYTSNGSVRTYTTPSGAVVDFSGSLISGPPKK